MTDKIAHRGPDDQGCYVSSNKRVGLGQRRLSIIDLSPLGHQPMSYLDRYFIVFNGEIYNFQTERDLLEKQGYHFKSKTDTEVIMALYDKYGVDCLAHLRGMFAFAIYDEQKKTLFCARDRVGKKPFKYYATSECFLFASELKAILTQKEVRKEIDFEAIDDFLAYQYVPAPKTGFKGIKKLLPGHYLMLDLSKKTVKIEKYWDLDYREKLNLSVDEWGERIRAKLEESTKLRMIADVPLGAFLSGGVDSSAIVAMMARNSANKVKTFSIGFKEERVNELKFAKIVAEMYGTDHTEFMVEPEAAEKILPMLAYQYEEPYADNSAVPTYYVSKLAREFVTVALNGDGGDENFGGYTKYASQKQALMLGKFIPLARPFYPVFKSLSGTHRYFKKAVKILDNFEDDYITRYIDFIAYFNRQLRKESYTKYFKEKLGKTEPFSIMKNFFGSNNALDPLDKTFYNDFKTYLPDALMTKVDMASMAVALEGRSPILDHEFIELTCQIPSSLKIKGFQNKKYIFKKSLEGLLPKEILYRPKAGFGQPIEEWFRGDLELYARSVIQGKNSFVTQLLKKEQVEKLFSDHKKMKTNHAYRLWILLMLELWHKEYFV